MELQVSTENEDEIRSGRTSTYEIDVDLAVPIIPLVTSTALGPEADIRLNYLPLECSETTGSRLRV